MDERILIRDIGAQVRGGSLAGAARLMYQYIYGESIDLADLKWRELWATIRPVFSVQYAPEAAEWMDKRFQEIAPTDPALLQLRLREGDKVAFLLGAGASKPDPSGLPTVEELLPELWRRAEKVGRDDLKRLHEWCDDRGITNIEDLLTAAQIADMASRNVGVLSLLDYFLFPRQTDGEGTAAYPRIRQRQTLGGRERSARADVATISLLQETLHTLLGLLTGPMIKAPPNAGHHAIANLPNSGLEVTVVTTNYDGCIDLALISGGVPFDYMLEGLGAAPDAGNRTALVKMHGSINWFYCESCQRVKAYELRHVRQSYMEDTLGYSVIGICPDCGGQQRPMIVPPLSFKLVTFPGLLTLWDRAATAFAAATMIVSVGYSFSEADTYITKMIAKAMAVDPGKRLVVIDTNPSVAELLKEKLDAVIDGFDKSRVVQSCESCEVILPKFAESVVSQASPKPKPNGRKRGAAPVP